MPPAAVAARSASVRHCRPQRSSVTVLALVALTIAAGGVSALSTSGGVPTTTTPTTSTPRLTPPSPPPPPSETDDGGGIRSATAEALLAASVAAGLIASSAACPVAPAWAADAADQSYPSADNPRAVRVDFRPGEVGGGPENPSALSKGAGAFAKALYADRLEFVEAAKEIRTAVNEVRTTLTPALEDLAGPGSEVKVSPPRDVRGAVREALSGRGTVVLNGEAVGLAVTSEEGVLDVRVTSRLLPRVPFRPSQTPPVTGEKSAAKKGTGTVSAPTVEAPAAVSVEVDGIIGEGADSVIETPEAPFLWDNFVSFLESPSSFNEDLTNLQVGEILTVPGIAAIYGISYQYYLSEIEKAEEEAAGKKKAIAEKKKKKKAVEKKKSDTDASGKKDVGAKSRRFLTKSKPAPAPAPAPEPQVEVGRGPVVLKRADASSSETAAVADRYEAAVKTQAEAAGAANEDDETKKTKRRLAVRVMKKMVMPWKSFKEL